MNSFLRSCPGTSSTSWWLTSIFPKWQKKLHSHRTRCGSSDQLWTPLMACSGVHVMAEHHHCGSSEGNLAFKTCNLINRTKFRLKIYKLCASASSNSKHLLFKSIDPAGLWWHGPLKQCCYWYSMPSFLALEGPQHCHHAVNHPCHCNGWG